MSLELLQQGLSDLNLVLSDKQQQQLLDYLSLLQKWNKVYNLTAIRDPELMMSHHLFDSLAVVPHIWSGRWLDVGCGAGLPSVMMAIARPDCQIVALDSNSKKTSFVQQVKIALGLDNLQVVCARVEAFRPEVLFDGIISRAFTELINFLQCTQHLLAENGHWAAMKGSPELELQKIQHDFEVLENIALLVPRLDAARCLVVVKPEVRLS